MSLIGTTFKSDAFFRRMKFLGTGHFVSTRFRGQVSFEDAVFQDSLLLNQAKFSGPVYLVGSRMMAGASFRLAILEHVVSIADSDLGADGNSDSARLDLSEARFRGAGGFAW